jgi:hypothetical protein
MTMTLAWAMWAQSQPERISEGAGPTCGSHAAQRLDQLNDRVLKDIGLTRHGILETPFEHHR